ncbi:MAG: rod shape-determining protein MreD [Rhodobacteraceae bacterium]|jgi:rod shape-determining protein MreD|nr:rod shape-determining protein MreD [Paracoccaceae bacterium]
MAETFLSSRWGYRGLFVLLAGGMLFFRLLPLSTQPGGVPGPDLMLCLAFAWVMRRPDYVPAPLIAAVFLVADMLMMRPPGLWALLVLLGSEFLRARGSLARALPFVLEWVLVGGVMGALMLANRLVLELAMVPQAGLGLTLLQMVLTVVAYPAVVIASHLGLGVTRAAPGKADGRGRRL